LAAVNPGYLSAFVESKKPAEERAPDYAAKTKDLVAGDAWTKHLPGSKDLEADWVGKKCGNFNTKTNKCGS
jgi:hypothetical protein